VEFEALLEDVGPGAGDLWDIVREALYMQLVSLSFLKIVAGCTLATALTAGIWSSMLPNRYVSTAVMRVSLPSNQAGAGSDIDRKLAALRHLQALQQTILSRSSLSALITGQNLYVKERDKYPLEDIVLGMRDRDLRIRPVPAAGDWTFAVEFANENPAAAQATVSAIVASLIERNLQVSMPDGSGGANLEVLDPASLPSRPVSPNRLKAIANGLGTGLVLGLVCGVAFLVIRRKERWSFRRIGAFAAAGMALGLTVAFLIPDEYVSTAVAQSVDRDSALSTVLQVLSEDSLATIIRHEGLFPAEPARGGMSQATRKMRESIHVQTVHAGPAAAFTISFRYADRWKAQQVTRDLVIRFTGTPPHVAEILDPPSLPDGPIFPNRRVIAMLGTLAGMVFGLAASHLRKMTPATT
jgi:uncharacterized protein involved in exopolysaccharide biosynthesis